MCLCPCVSPSVGACLAKSAGSFSFEHSLQLAGEVGRIDPVAPRSLRVLFLFCDALSFPQPVLRWFAKKGRKSKFDLRASGRSKNWASLLENPSRASRVRKFAVGSRDHLMVLGSGFRASVGTQET